MRRKRVIDVTGTPLTPSWKGNKCLGNGEHEPEYECCCDECNYYLRCFPQFDWEFRVRRIKNKKLISLYYYIADKFRWYDFYE